MKNLIVHNFEAEYLKLTGGQSNEQEFRKHFEIFSKKIQEVFETALAKDQKVIILGDDVDNHVCA